MKKMTIGFIVFFTVIFQVGAPRGLQRSSGICRLPSSLYGVAAADESAAKCDAIVIWPQEKSDLKPDPALSFGRLKNGFRYVLMKNREPKDRVSLHLNVQVGSLHEREEERGLAHFLEHMLFNGSTHFKAGELVKYFQRIGMQFGPDANAHTSFNETVYDILLPSGNRDQLEEAFLVMQDYAQGALLEPAEIESERKVVLAEKRARDSVGYRTFEATLAFEMPEALLPKRLPIGEESVLKSLDQHLLKTFYDAWYRPENMILVMVGDFEKSEAVPLIESYFGAMQARAPARPLPQLGDISHSGVKAFNHHEKEAGATSVTIELVCKVMREPDSLAFQRRMLIKDVADQIVQNRLNRMLQKPDTPFTSASINTAIYLQEIFSSDISAACPPEKWEETLVLLEQTLRKALSFEFTEGELERVKKDFLSDFDEAVKSAPTRKSQYLSRAIIGHLNSDRVFQAPSQERKLYSPIVQQLTAKEVHEAFKGTWNRSHRLVLVTGDADLGEEAEKKILGAYEKSIQTAVAKPKEIKQVEFPYLPEPEGAPAAAERKFFQDEGILCVDFENGFRLNAKQTDYKANEILFALGFGRGRSSEPQENPGLAPLAEEVLNESGTRQLTKDQLEQALAGKNTYVRFRVDEDRFLFAGESVTDELPLVFQLLYAWAVDKGYREDAYRLSLDRFEQRYQGLSHAIEGAMELSGSRFLAGGDSRFGLPEWEVFEKNTLQDVQRWIGDALAEDALELSIVGDFEVEQAVLLAGRYFGSLKKRQGSLPPTERKGPKLPEAGLLEIQVPTKLEKGLVDVAYATEDFWNICRTRRLVILSQVFSEMMRLRVREKMGAAYSPFAYNEPSRAYPGYGIFHAMVQVAPSETGRVIQEVKSIAADIARKGISEDELKRSVDPVLTSLKDIRRTNPYWLNSVLDGLKRYPQQVEWSRSMVDDYASITREEIQSLAQKYLNNDKAAAIVITPRK